MVEQFGADQPEVWKRYMEVERDIGNKAIAVEELYTRALDKLRPEFIADFKTEYSLIKADMD